MFDKTTINFGMIMSSLSANLKEWTLKERGFPRKGNLRR